MLTRSKFPLHGIFPFLYLLYTCLVYLIILEKFPLPHPLRHHQHILVTHPRIINRVHELPDKENTEPTYFTLHQQFGEIRGLFVKGVVGFAGVLKPERHLVSDGNSYEGFAGCRFIGVIYNVRENFVHREFDLALQLWQANIALKFGVYKVNYILEPVNTHFNCQFFRFSFRQAIRLAVAVYFQGKHRNVIRLLGPAREILNFLLHSENSDSHRLSGIAFLIKTF